MNDFVQMEDKLQSVGKINSNDYWCSRMLGKKVLGYTNCFEWPHLDGGDVPYGSVCRESEHIAFFFFCPELDFIAKVLQPTSSTMWSSIPEVRGLFPTPSPMVIMVSLRSPSVSTCCRENLPSWHARPTL